MVATALRTAAAASCRVRLNDTADGLMMGPPAAITPDVRATVAAHKPALITALAAVHAEAGAIAALLRTLRHTRSEAAPAGVTLALNADGLVVALPSRRAVPAPLQAQIKALVGPLSTYLLTREMEVAWRAGMMRRQMRGWPADGDPGLLPPFMLAGRSGWPDFAHCFSCGNPLAHDPEWAGVASAGEPGYGEWVRCADCLAAVARVQAETGELEGCCWCGGYVHRYLSDGSPVCEVHAGSPWCPLCWQRPVALGRFRLDGLGRPLHRVCPSCRVPGGQVREMAEGVAS